MQVLGVEFRRNRLVCIDAEFDVTVYGKRFEQGGTQSQVLGDVHVRVIGLDGTGFQPSGVQQVVDVPLQQPGIADDQLEIAT
ncbi:hypothetical protein PJK48_18740 [Mycobacterium kansasii]